MRLPIAVRDDGFSWLYAITPPCTEEKLRRKCVSYLEGIADIREIGVGVGFGLNFPSKNADLLGTKDCIYPAIPEDITALLDDAPGDAEHVKRVYHHSKEKYGNRYCFGALRAYANIRYLLNRGTDPFTVLLEEAKRLGMKTWARVELRPGGPRAFRDREASFCILDANGKRTRHLDFKYEETRRLYLSVIEEIIDKGVDGISLDLCVYPPFLSEPLQNGDCFTEFLRMLRCLSARYDRRIEIIARLPMEPESHGLLYRDWIKEGLVDVLIPSVILPGTAFDVPNEPYVEVTKGSDVLVFGCMRPKITSLDPDPRPGDEENGIYRFNRPNTPEIDYARAALILEAGAHGIQLGLGSAMAPKPESLPGTGPYTDNWHDYYEYVSDTEFIRFASKTYPIVNEAYIPFCFARSGHATELCFRTADDIPAAKEAGKRVRAYICPTMRALEEGERLLLCINEGEEFCIDKDTLRGNMEKPVFYRHSGNSPSEWNTDALICDPEEFTNGWWLRGRKEIEVPAECFLKGHNKIHIRAEGLHSPLYVGDVDIDIMYE